MMMPKTTSISLSGFPLTKRDYMQILKQHVIPDLIQIQLVEYNTDYGNFATPTRMPVPHFEIHWRFWRLDTDAIPKGGPPLRGWAGANWSHATTIKIEAEQWFDVAVARVSNWIIQGQDIPIDIMHDHGQAA